MAWSTHDYDKVPGTYVFNGRRSVMGYPLNRMCMSFNSAENRDAFTRDEEAYCEKYGLSPEQREAIRARDVLRLVQLGGNIYYLAKFAGIFGLSVQDVGAQQRGMRVEDFKDMLEKSTTQPVSSNSMSWRASPRHRQIHSAIFPVWLITKAHCARRCVTAISNTPNWLRSRRSAWSSRSCTTAVVALTGISGR